MTLYSQMTETELKAEMEQLRDKGTRAHNEQNWSEYEVLMTKWYLAKSYLMLQTHHIEIGKTYTLYEEYDRLTVTHFDGVMAWGIRESTAQEASVPIAMLMEYGQEHDS